ncbi:hypothetical protein NUW58_g7825 [Xylaria curta]|uniref:Uncharacterized protein n=1 Tax=Xylaria curta TaxID=42375 RepID=A0ACC1NEP3_9PEZI|nr:hypothetical protein NUW58_g7825 [Xylaria curta]
MPFAQKIAGIICLALVGMANPIHSTPPSSKRAQLSGGYSNILVQPTMYQVFPLEESKSGPAVSQLEVQRTGQDSMIENIAVFKGIPKEAKLCTLGWIQAVKEERTEFTVEGNGLLAAQQLPELPEGDLSWKNIKPIADKAVEQGQPLLHPDTTFWPDVHEAWSHIAGPVDCHETIYLKIQVDYRDGEGYVLLGQDAINGLTLEFNY